MHGDIVESHRCAPRTLSTDPLPIIDRLNVSGTAQTKGLSTLRPCRRGIPNEAIPTVISDPR